MNSNDDIKKKFQQAWDAAAPFWSAQEFSDTETFWKPISEKIVELAELDGDFAILDAACGTGAMGIYALRCSGISSSLLGVDFSQEMINKAKEDHSDVTNASFQVEDMEQMSIQSDSFDRIVSRFGIMFAPDPVKAMAECHRVAKDGAIFCGSTWAPVEGNSWSEPPMFVMSTFLNNPPPADAPGPFAMADLNHLKDFLIGGGWKNPIIETVRFVDSDNSAEYHWQRFLRIAGPFTRQWNMFTEEERSDAENIILARYRSFIDNGGITAVAHCFRAEY